MTTIESRPSIIPAPASNVRSNGEVWIFEFSHGAAVYLWWAALGEKTVWIEDLPLIKILTGIEQAGCSAESHLRNILADQGCVAPSDTDIAWIVGEFERERPRYRAALAAEQARRLAYEQVDYEDDEDDWDEDVGYAYGWD